MYSFAFSDGFLMSIKHPSTTPIVFGKPTKKLNISSFTDIYYMYFLGNVHLANTNL